jgi:hypothetical protein
MSTSSNATPSGSQACGSGATSSVSASAYPHSAYPHSAYPHSASAYPHSTKPNHSLYHPTSYGPSSLPPAVTTISHKGQLILTQHFKSLGGATMTEPSLVFSTPQHVALTQKLTALRIVAEDAMTAVNTSPEVLDWMILRMEEVNGQIQKVKDETHVTNAKLLAERIIIKFIKYQTSRFTPAPQSDFYDGSACVNRAIKFNPVLLVAVQNVANKCSFDAEEILSNLHVGLSSLHRFKDFISCQ